VIDVRKTLTSFALCGALWCGCGDKAETAAIVEVQSDLDAALTRVDVELRDTDDRAIGDSFSFDNAVAKYSVPFSFRVVQAHGHAEFVVRATGFEREAFVTEMKARVRFVPGETIHRVVQLAAACGALRCADGATCDPGSAACAPIPAAIGATEPSGGAGHSAAAGQDAGTAGRKSPTTAGEGGRGAAAAGGAGSAGDAQSSAGASEPAAMSGQSAGGTSATQAGSGGRVDAAGSGGAAASAGGGAGQSGAAAGDGGSTAADRGGSGAAGTTANAGRSAAGSGGIAAAGSDGNSGDLTTNSAWAAVAYQGRNYIVQNNVFNPDATQTIHYEGTSFSVTSVMGSADYGVSFPSVFIGSVYYRDTTNSNLPMQVSAIKGIDVSFSHNAGSVAGTYNAFSAGWFSAGTPREAGGPSGGYLEVWYFASPDQRPPGSITEAAVSIAGVAGQWDVWQGTCNDHPCIEYLRTQPITSFQGDLSPFFADAVKRSGALQSSWLLTGLFCGFEIHAGGVGLHADSISMIVR
jgi:hypothetical protein